MACLASCERNRSPGRDWRGLRELLEIREQGFALTENQYETGLRGISVPIKSRHGKLVGALSVSMLISTCSKAEASAKCVPALQAAANSVMLWV